MYDYDNLVYAVRKAFREMAEEKLKNTNLHYYISDLDVGQISEDVMKEFLQELATDETMLKKLAAKTAKKAIEKDRQRELRRKATEAEGRVIWNHTKGKIPCSGGCGYIRDFTKDEILRGHGVFICKDCCDGLGHNKSIEVLHSRSLRSICGIQS